MEACITRWISVFPLSPLLLPLIPHIIFSMKARIVTFHRPLGTKSSRLTIHTSTTEDMDGMELGTQPVSAIPQGWIEPATNLPIATSQISNDDAGTNRPSQTFRVIFSWKGQIEEKEWIRQFIEAPYEMLGHRAHEVALLCETVEGRHVLLRRKWQSDFRGEDDEDEEEEDMGF